MSLFTIVHTGQRLERRWRHRTGDDYDVMEAAPLARLFHNVDMVFHTFFVRDKGTKFIESPPFTPQAGADRGPELLGTPNLEHVM